VSVRAILLDVEGTTTPVAFVFQVLFPYAREHVHAFLRERGSDPAVRDAVEQLRAEHARDQAGAQQPPPWPAASGEAAVDAAVAYIHWLMDRDRKSTPLKAIQGQVWEAGYRNGSLRGQVYPDVPAAFARWRRQGRDLAIFSSGSVLAQRLLFAHSTAGDLTLCIRAYFDTTTGPKTEPQSYRRIAAALDCAPADVLFLSDVPAELDAASQAGLRTALCVRDSAVAPPAASHPVLHSFDDLLLDG
jgi:enolase-phosphatase E1